MRYFKSPLVIAAAVRDAVMQSLEQPNGKADEPWSETGDFVVDDQVFLALGPHHTEGEFWEPMIQLALSSGVTEITQAEYEANRPVTEP